jgi:GntR family transcriptional regulator, transcriptional repressor for pyruvate dehydrogenase complex
MSRLGDVLERSFAFHRYSLYATPEDDARFLEQHRRVAQAIRARDPDAAAACMAKHLAAVLANYSDREEAAATSPSAVRGASASQACAASMIGARS